MLLISLDEQGNNFENICSGAPYKLHMIAGVVYDDYGYPEEIKKERERLNDYFVKVLERLSIDNGKEYRYPRSLHAGNGVSLEDVKKVKTALEDHLPEFLKEGTLIYEGENLLSGHDPRKGKYHLYGYILSECGITEYNNASDINRDDYAGNRYTHMATGIVRKLIAQNEEMDSGTIMLELAKRKVVDPANWQEYDVLKYTMDRVETGNRMYDLMDPKIYIQSVRDSLIEYGKTDTQIQNPRIVSINYMQANPKMAFLFLADLLCSHYSYNPAENTDGWTSSRWLEEIDKKMWKLNGTSRSYQLGDPGNGIIYIYDDIDWDYDLAWKEMINGNWGRIMDLLYKIKDKSVKDKNAEYYTKRWFPVIEKQVRKRFTIDSYRDAVNDLLESSRKNNIDPYKLEFCYTFFEKLEGEYLKTNGKKDVCYKLHDIGAAAYNHLARSSEAAEAMIKRNKYKLAAGREEYENGVIKEAVNYQDEFFPEKGLRKLKPYCDKIGISEDFQLTQEQMEEEPLVTARVLSQIGQCYSNLNNPLAEKAFQAALSLKVLEDDAPNRKITLSYLLHWYIQNGSREKYCSCLADYCDGRTDPEEQLDYILTNGSNHGRNSLFHMGYALYVFVKGVTVFRLEEGHPNFTRKLASIENEVGKYGEYAKQQIGGHPWELIYKHLAFIMHRRKNPSESSYISQAKSVIKREMLSAVPLFNAMVQNGQVQYYKMTGNEKEEIRYLEETVKSVRNIPGMEPISDSEPKESKEEKISRHLIYMYD